MPDVRATTLVTLDEVRRYVLGDVFDTSRDDRLALLADAASARIEAYTGRVFAARTRTDAFRGTGQPSVRLVGRPLLSVTAVTVGGVAVSAGAWEIEAEAGRLTLTGGVFDRGALCTVTYRAGYEAADRPADVVEACLQLTKYLWDERETGATFASSVSIGPQSISVRPGLPDPLRDALRAWVDTRY